jgi:hypothetical protein
MGSKGGKPRKGRYAGHLAKVGTTTENERLLHEEQHAVLDNMGLGGRATWVKIALAVVLALVVAAGIVTLVSIY